MPLSRRYVFLTTVLQAIAHVTAVRFSVRGEVGSPAHLSRRDHVLGLDNGNNIQYFTNITLGGQQFGVSIDTGSSDLWVAGVVPNANDTGASAKVTYAIGQVQGPVRTAPLEFAGFTVPDQAFFQVVPADNTPSGFGLIGLGPNDASHVHTALKNKPAGDAVLDRIFSQDRSTPNFLTVLLSRSDDPDEQYPGDITVGELLPGYEAVADAPKVNVTSVGTIERLEEGQHWQALMDVGGIVGPDGQAIDVTSHVSGTADKRQLTAIFDTGFTLPQVPKDVSDAIYSRIEGAQFQNINATGPIWTLPCDAEVNVTIRIGGQPFPIHPLDTNFELQLPDDNGTHLCVGSFQPITSGASSSFDVILGMAFLRNAYLLINFGDFLDGTNATAPPFVQLLALTNDTALAHRDFVNVRLGGVDRTGDQHTQAAPASSSGDGQSFFTRHRSAVLIGAAVGGGVLLLIAGCVVLKVVRRRRRQRQGAGAAIGMGGVYRKLQEPAPAGEMEQVRDYRGGESFSTPWDKSSA
ncbi:acid protease [Artomyces pyxidatus]|uniref:Acid protease n=1 Tax=Artomyces pyxidatus TaxID=48021 RepID=A0ACB8TGL8_9AGAM|nr:acid protease [Artomyces pyxidatus]